jgi:hypothetical protein
MTVLQFWIRLRPRDAKRPRRCFYLPPKEGVGNAGCPMHPRSRVQIVVVERTRVTTSTPESPGIPARNGFNGFLRALPGDRALLPPSSADTVLSKPGRADLPSANLTPASGRQDHTTSPYAATSLVRSLCDRSQVFRPALQPRRAQNAAASTASHPASVTIMIRPSCGVGWREFVEMICPTGEAKYFCKEGWTPLSTSRPTGKSLACGENTFLVSQMRCSSISAFTSVSTRYGLRCVGCRSGDPHESRFAPRKGDTHCNLPMACERSGSAGDRSPCAVGAWGSIARTHGGPAVREIACGASRATAPTKGMACHDASKASFNVSEPSRIRVRRLAQSPQMSGRDDPGPYRLSRLLLRMSVKVERER